MNKLLKIFSFGIVFGLGFMIVVGISYLIIKATRSSTNPGSDAAPNDLYVSNGETLKASKRNSLVDKSLSCPAGFTLVANKGNTIGCIQSTIQGNATLINAIQDCYSTFGGRLPTYDELYIAAKNYPLPGATRVRTSNVYAYYSTSRQYLVEVINTSTLASGPSGRTNARDYRCFIPR